MKACIIIPARFASSRFPGKPLTKLHGKEMILWVAENCCRAVKPDDVYIATDNKKISELVVKKGFQVINTGSNLLTGTDRVAEASKKLNYEIFINVQGDEPLIDHRDILRAIDLKKQYPESIINSYCYIEKNENPYNKNIPKVATTENNDLIYISRSVIPQSKKDIKNYSFKKQVCIYAYSKNDLNKFLSYGRKSELEKIEDIEILRFFEFGKNIKMYKASKSSLAVDIPEDVELVEKELSKNIGFYEKI